MKNILLTGASGTVGSAILKQLTKKEDVNITVFDVQTPKSKKTFKPYLSKINLIYGDIRNAKDVEKVSHNQDVVFHLAAIIPPLADEYTELAYDVNVNGSKNLIKAIEKNSPQAFFIYSSSVSVYGDRVENPQIRVGDSLIPSVGDHYATTKLEVEEAIKTSNLNWSIFRLGAIMENHKISKLMFHMPLATTFEICTPEDTARAFIRAIPKQDQLQGKIFNLGGGIECTTTFREFLELSFKIYGLGKLNFPEYTFAKTNFHCGYYADGIDLENIVHFREDDLTSYFIKANKKISPFVKVLGNIFQYPIKKYLESLSEPLKAIRENDIPAIKRFFGVEMASIYQVQ